MKFDKRKINSMMFLKSILFTTLVFHHACHAKNFKKTTDDLKADVNERKKAMYGHYQEFGDLANSSVQASTQTTPLVVDDPGVMPGILGGWSSKTEGVTITNVKTDVQNNVNVGWLKDTKTTTTQTTTSQQHTVTKTDEGLFYGKTVTKIPGEETTVVNAKVDQDTQFNAKGQAGIGGGIAGATRSMVMNGKRYSKGEISGTEYAAEIGKDAAVTGAVSYGISTLSQTVGGPVGLGVTAVATVYNCSDPDASWKECGVAALKTGVMVAGGVGCASTPVGWVACAALSGLGGGLMEVMPSWWS